MLFRYKAIDNTGSAREGTIDAINVDVAISSLQRRGLVLSAIELAEEKSLLAVEIGFLNRVSNKDIVVLSRQIATLFEAQISALRVFRLLGTESGNLTLQKALAGVADELQAGSSISKALEKYPKVFSSFYVNMVAAGEESGKLDQVFMFLADYLDRTYEVTSRVRNALIYPAFVVTVFIAVMALMLTLVIPRLSSIIEESGQEVPIYTKAVIGLSAFFVNYGVFLLIALIIGGFFFWRYYKTRGGQLSIDLFKLSVPYLGNLYKMLYLSRIADNFSTMLSSGIPMVRAIEVTSPIVGNAIYEEVLKNAVEDVKAGKPVSDALSQYTPHVPGIFVQMIKVGEESGELGNILNTLAKFYRREVNNSVDTLVSLIEPTMIVLLGVGVGVLLASVLIPIYNISAGV